ncbi:helix-turn-helix domain-containing protein [Paucihalobacter sp.]|uniref:helix-turn-helix domain-containing protein n=1 Tax=Paucihalobacter sp. TaxID=2850405 RepID=UPI002FE0F7DA
MFINNEFELALKFANNTDRSLFLSGKAGTGKTTFLHKLREDCLKRMVVVAPTGVAAINAKGVTIHSFFQIPFGPIIPNQELRSSKDFRFSKTKINIIKSLDLLIIDEISMVRADLLDCIDSVLRRFRNRDLVFGGVQVLMIGDLQQLSPVVKDHEWELLKPFYQSIYFFDSIAFKSCDPLTIELLHIYRQDNPIFIDILNEIRNNALTQASADALNKQFNPDFRPSEHDGYISLTTHNHKAEKVNDYELSKLKGKSITYSAEVEGKFPPHSFPNKESFELKKGAQVMFIKNDSSQDKRYYNGKIGKVVQLDEDEVIVQCLGDEYEIVTTPEVWENFDYSVDNETNAITEHKIGSFKQMPLRLAWAITIHKSQGLTFEKAIIDAQDAFAHGQTYVALSRCKSLEGIILRSKIVSNQIITDRQVLSFNKNTEANRPTEAILRQSQCDYQLNLINEIFDYYPFLRPIKRLLDIYYKNKSSIEGTLETILNSIKIEISLLLEVNNKFITQLKSLTVLDQTPEQSEIVQKRFIKAVSYFDNQLQHKISEPFKSFEFTTDNNALEKDLLKHVKMLEELISTKLFYYKSLQQGFDTVSFLKLKAEAIFLNEEQPKTHRKAIISSTSNARLFELLRSLRSDLAEEHNQIHYQIFTQKSLYAMCEFLPTNKQELKAIHGMGKTRIEKYGDSILDLIKNYCATHDIEVRNDIPSYKSPKKEKVDTKKVSLELYNSGKTLEEIAGIRELNENTIFGHLASFIPTGQIKIFDLMSESHYKELTQIIPTKTFENLSDLKHQLDDKYTYAELRLVLNTLEG